MELIKKKFLKKDIMKKKILILLSIQLITSSLLSIDLTTEKKGTTYFIIINQPDNPEETLKANEMRQSLSSQILKNDEIIIDAEFSYRKCHGSRIVTLRTNEFILQDFINLIRRTIKSDECSDEYYIPVKNYQVDENGKINITTKNELRIFNNQNLQDVTRQKTITEIKEKGIVIYRDQNRIANEIIWKIKTKDKFGLIAFLKHEGIFELVNTINFKIALRNCLREENKECLFDKFYELSQRIDSSDSTKIYEIEKIAIECANLLINQ